MKFAKLSLAAVAAMAFTSGAVAFDLNKITIKPYLKTKLYYETIDYDKNPSDKDLFNQAVSSGQALAQIGATGKLNGCWGYGLEYSVADTLGLENNLVSATRMGYSWQDTEDEPTIDTQDWMSQGYLTFRGCGTPLKNTTFKIGRQYLDTPLAFTETWNLAPNSFDAIVAVNKDIQNVAVVGAYVGRGNGTFGRVTNGEDFDRYVKKGAYALGLLTNFGLPVNVWYYNVRDVAKAWWADAAYTLPYEGVKYNFGLQYGSMDPDATGADDTSGGAIKLGADFGDYSLMAAYSKMDDDGVLPLANTATGFKKTKLYTAGIYTDGTGVAVPGSEAWKVKGSAKTSIGKFTAQYVCCENDSATVKSNSNAMTNVKEMDLIYGTKVLGINTKLIYINRDVDDAYAPANPSAKSLKQDTQHVRIVLSKEF